MSNRFLIADLFAGAGGFSTGAMRALIPSGITPEIVCVNHWARAIETHQANHPGARHHCADLAAVRPIAVVPEGRLDLLMASPTCTYHSRARGGRPTSDQQRMDPWHVVTWLTELRVKRLIVENVPEFQFWGPVSLTSGRPMASRRGEYFRAWVAAIEALGFRTQWRIINSADHGDATTRERFFLIGRSDGKRLNWAEPTRSRTGDATLFDQAPRPWRPARDIIDWSIRGTSIYDRPRPLAPATLRRIHAGLVKFRWPEPYLVVLRRHMDARSIDLPVPTLSAGGNHIGLAEPIVPGTGSWSGPRSVEEPVPTILTGGFHAMVAPYYGSGSGKNCRSADEPLPTATAKARFGLVMPITHADAGNRSRALDEPILTITTANRGELAFITAAFGERERQGARIHDLGRPVPTILAQGRINLAEPAIGGREGDILFRMFQPHELAAAMGFHDGAEPYRFTGTKTEIIKQIGNAVPVNTAAALVGALCADEATAGRQMAESA